MEAHRPVSNFKPRLPTGAPCRFVPYGGLQPPDDPDEIPWQRDPNDGAWWRVVGDGVNPNGTPWPPPKPPKPKAPYKPRKKIDPAPAEETHMTRDLNPSIPDQTRAVDPKHDPKDHDEFQWPLFQPLDDPLPLTRLPAWLQKAHAAGDFRIADDLGHLKTPEGELTVRPGDWIIRIKQNGLLAVWSNGLHTAFVSSQADQPTGHTSPADPADLGMEGAEFGPLPGDAANIEAGRRIYGDDPTKWPGWDDNHIHADPHNAHLEGADQPDEPDTSDPKAA
jgi:hypothetical protein